MLFLAGSWLFPGVDPTQQGHHKNILTAQGEMYMDGIIDVITFIDYHKGRKLLGMANNCS